MPKSVSFLGPPTADISGRWSLEFDGMHHEMELRQDGPAVTGWLTSVDSRREVSGSVKGRNFSGSIGGIYGNPTDRIDLEIAPDGQKVAGRILSSAEESSSITGRKEAAPA